jgi:septum formation protein
MFSLTLPIILASESPRRLALLEQIGITPTAVMAADIDETPWKAESPKDLALRMAEQKALTVAEKVTGTSLVLAADTVSACGRRILPKAINDEEVATCLRLLSGRRHTVTTGVVVVKVEDGLVTACRKTHVVTRLKAIVLSEALIQSYVASQEGIGKAGGCSIQGKAAAFFPWINGSITNIIGLPLTETIYLLQGMQ